MTEPVYPTMIWSDDRTPMARALDYAKLVIQNYEMDVRNSEWVGVDLVARGFCQGHIYRDALRTIDRIAAGHVII